MELTYADRVKPFKVKTSCGHIVVRPQREATAGLHFDPEAEYQIEAPQGRPCDACETEPVNRCNWCGTPAASVSDDGECCECAQRRAARDAASWTKPSPLPGSWAAYLETLGTGVR